MSHHCLKVLVDSNDMDYIELTVLCVDVEGRTD